MAPPLRTRVPYRHDRLVVGREGLPALSLRFQSRVPVRPARIVFQGHPRPHTTEMARWIHDHDPRRAEDGRRPPHFPFAYRGYVAEPPEAGQPVAVRLWEEPSGRPLEGELPRDWFHDVAPHKGMPFRLITWMVEDEARALVPRGRVARLFARAAGEGTER